MTLPPRIIDTHCHLDVPELVADLEAILAACRQVNVTDIVVPAIDAPGWPRLLDICSRPSTPRLAPALGLHPVYVQRHREDDLDALARAVAEHRPVAVGEIGLDYYLRELDRTRQQRLLEGQLEIARHAGLPVLLHVRKAHDQVLAAIARVPVVGGIAHAFNGSLQQAHRYIDLGLKLGFGGMLTYARSTKLRALAAALPIESIVLETDAPDMTVAAHRGERNSPAYLPDVLAALAEVRREDPTYLAAHTTANALSVLRLA